MHYGARHLNYGFVDVSFGTHVSGMILRERYDEMAKSYLATGTAGAGDEAKLNDGRGHYDGLNMK